MDASNQNETQEKIGPITEKFALKNIEKFLDKKGKDIEKQISDKLDSFTKTANEQIASTDKKFSGMFNFLTRKFLNELENRVYSLELANKTLLLLFTDKLYEIEASKGGAILTKEDFAKALELEYIQKITQVHNENVAASNSNDAPNEEVKNEESPSVADESIQNEVSEEATTSEDSAK